MQLTDIEEIVYVHVHVHECIHVHVELWKEVLAVYMYVWSYGSMEDEGRLVRTKVVDRKCT